MGRVWTLAGALMLGCVLIYLTVGFMGKLSLLTAALSKGHLALVIIAMINAAIAVYYYLSVVREAWFRDPGDLPFPEPPRLLLDSTSFPFPTCKLAHSRW